MLCQLLAAGGAAAGGAACGDGRQALLSMRGGSVPLGASTQLSVLHSVLLGLLANAFADTLVSTLVEPFQHHAASRPVRFYGCRCLAVLLSFYAIFLLTGYVPMGYVEGANPVLSFFTPPS